MGNKLEIPIPPLLAIPAAITMYAIANSNDPTPTQSYTQPAPTQSYKQQAPTQSYTKPAPTKFYKPASSISKELFIKKGPMGELIYQKVENGLHFYVKKNLLLQAIENYKWASKEGVGPPIADVNYLERSVKIEAGINPIVAIKGGMLTKQTAISQVEDLRAILRGKKRAHCDVKMENCLYFVNFGKIFLIDNGEITDYGLLRPVNTLGENSTMLGTGQIPGVAGPFTDEKGFKNIIQALYCI